MRRKLLSALLCLTLLASFCGVLTTQVAAADSIAPLAVYLRQGSTGTPVLVHTYTQAEMEALSSATPQYYTGIDSMPSVVQGKGIGVSLSALINDLKYDNPDVDFGPGDSLKISASDGATHTFDYDYLLGATRYCYPDLYTSTDGTILGGTDDAEPVEPMFYVTAYQARSFAPNNILTRQVIDAQTMDTSKSYRFGYGLLPSDAANNTINVNKFLFWIIRIDIILPGDSTTTNSATTNSSIASSTLAPAAGTTAPATSTPTRTTASAAGGSIFWIIGGSAAVIVAGLVSLIAILNRRKSHRSDNNTPWG